MMSFVITPPMDASGMMHMLDAPFRSYMHELPPGLCFGMEVSRDPLGFIMDAVLLFHSLLKLCL